jgi:hypothetical protein
MKWLGKLWRLFVDDRLLAAAVPFWCLLCALAAPYLPATARAALLLAGLAAALTASVVRAAGIRDAEM